MIQKKIQAVGRLHGILVPDDFEIVINNTITIHTDVDRSKSIVDAIGVNQIGRFVYEQILNRHEYESVFIELNNDDWTGNDLYDALAQLFSTIHIISNGLFLIKDHGMSLPYIACIADGKPDLYSCRIDYHKTVEDDTQEIISLEEMSQGFSLVQELYNLSYPETEVAADGIGNETVLLRCFTIIDSARSTHFPLLRVAMFVNAIECLLSRDSRGVSNKLPQRLAQLLGSNYEEKKHIKEVALELYDIRSKYFHGLKVDYQLDKLQKFEMFAVKYLRKLIIRIDSRMISHPMLFQKLDDKALGSKISEH